MKSCTEFVAVLSGKLSEIIFIKQTHVLVDVDLNLPNAGYAGLVKSSLPF